MDSINKIDSEIYEMEQNLLNIIKEKVDLFDPEVIVASEQLDSILDEYSHLIQLSQIRDLDKKEFFKEELFFCDIDKQR